MKELVLVMILAVLYAGTIYLMWLRNYYRLPKEIRAKDKRRKKQRKNEK